jgi:hypothetical protein
MPFNITYKNYANTMYRPKFQGQRRIRHRAYHPIVLRRHHHTDA